MMKTIGDATRSGLLAFVALCAVAFAAMVTLIDFDAFMAALHAARFAISIVIVFVYLPALWPSLRKPFDRVPQLILAIVVTSAVEAAMGLWGTVWRVSDQTWMLTSPVLALLVYCKVVSGGLFLTAPGTIDGQIPRRNWITLAVASSIAMLLVGIVIGAQWGPGWLRRF